MPRSTAVRFLVCLPITGVLLLVMGAVGGANTPALAEAPGAGSAALGAEPATTRSEVAAIRSEVTWTETYTTYVPMVIVPEQPASELQNGGFEGGWWRETLTGQEFGEIFVPESWTAFWNTDDTIWGRPEMRIIQNAAPYLNPPRVHAGNQALSWFTFWRNGDAGVLQQVSTSVGTAYRAEGYAHVWYSQGDDPYVSEWESGGTWYTIQDGDPGMEVMIGIDPYGGLNPWSGDVVWTSRNFYDQYEALSVEVTAQAQTITVFVRARTLYSFKHCDAYWDAVTLTAVP